MAGAKLTGVARYADILGMADAGAGPVLDFVDATIAALNRALAAVPPERVRLHVCWGNYEGPHTCDVPLEARKKDLVSPDAVKLMQRVGANIVATSTLFGIWRYSLSNLDAARQSVTKLYSHDGGFFK